MASSQPFTYEAVILAGGAGSRMGGVDKGLVCWRGKPLVDHVMGCLQRQTVEPSRVMISANRNLDTYRKRAPVLVDATPGFDGPLRGIQSALYACQTDILAVVPCDTPMLPAVLVQRMYERGSGQSAFASAGGIQHPLCCLLRRSDLTTLDAFLMSGERRVRSFLALIHATEVAFDDSETGSDARDNGAHTQSIVHAFANFNSPEMLDRSRQP